MKKSIFFGAFPFLVVLLITSLLISSCKKDEEEKIEEEPPIAVVGEQMPNGDMELWTDLGLGYEDPDDWQTPNASTTILQIYSTTKSTDAAQGTYSAKLETKSVGGFNTPGVITLGKFNVDYVNFTAYLTGGIPFTEKPTSLSGSFKNLPAAGDSTLIIVYFTKYNTAESKTDTIGLGVKFNTETIASWTEFSIPINYFNAEEPDTMNLHVVSSNMLNPQEGSTMYIDNLVFGYPEGTSK